MNGGTNITSQILLLRDKDLQVELIDNNEHQLLICIPGPEGSPFESIHTWWQFVIPQGYPSQPPAIYSRCRHDTSLPHPNLFPDPVAKNTKRLCVGVLRDWPAEGRSLYEVVRMVKALLAKPAWSENADSTLTADNWKSKVLQWTQAARRK